MYPTATMSAEWHCFITVILHIPKRHALSTNLQQKKSTYSIHTNTRHMEVRLGVFHIISIQFQNDFQKKMQHFFHWQILGKDSA